MRFSIQSFVLGIFLLSSLLGFSQGDKYKNAVKVTEQIPSGTLKVGDVIDLVYKLKISDGFHVYCANQPTKKGGQPALYELLPGTSGIELVGGLQDGPERKVHKDEIFRVDVAEFHGTGTLTQKVKITSENPVLKAKLKYQVCDENLCQYVDYMVNFSPKVVSGQPGPPQPKAATPPTPPAPPKMTPGQKETPKSAAEKAKLKADSIAQAKTLEQPAPTETPVAKEETPVDETAILNKVLWSSPVLEPSTKPKKGDIITLIFKAKIDKGYHLFSAIPPKQQANLPTTFDLIAGESKGVEIEGPLMEAGNKKTMLDEVFKTDVIYYEDSVTFTQKIKITEDNPTIKGYINYQVCDSTKCIPAKNDFSMNWGEGDVVSPPEEGDSLWMIFLKSLGLGLAAVFTPCVFPMIPLTVSFFTKKSGTRAKGIFNALFYGLSIIGIYTLLGLLVSILFGADTMQQIAINKWVNIGF
ncbi:MAG: protein-disulfide reductase DsbD domain-containing protein, partial [Bacteroidia bacterium]